MIKVIADLYEATVLKHPRIILFLLLLVLVGFATQISQFRLDASSDSLLLENDEDYRRYINVVKRYGVRANFVRKLSPPKATYLTRTPSI